jgi:large subunit ribosomal protein L9
MSTLKLILTQEVTGLGSSGDTVEVKGGYGRNYLLPRGLAAPATEKDVVKLEHERRVIAVRNAKLAKDLQSQVDKLSQVSVSLPRSVGEGDKLYGSVTNGDIAEALKEQGHPIEAKKIVLNEPIKTLGMTEVSIKLGKDATAKIKVWVVKKEA